MPAAFFTFFIDLAKTCSAQADPPIHFRKRRRTMPFYGGMNEEAEPSARRQVVRAEQIVARIKVRKGKIVNMQRSIVTNLLSAMDDQGGSSRRTLGRHGDAGGVAMGRSPGGCRVLAYSRRHQDSLGIQKLI
jgi:hypothetical protein